MVRQTRIGVGPAGSKATRRSLADLRSEAALYDDPAALLRLRRRLRGDARAGAHSLSEALTKRIASARREQRRVEALFALRGELRAAGAQTIAGIDEVGVGPLAGPVVAAAVILREQVDLPGLDDSKKLSRAVRERLDTAIREQAIAIGIAEVEPQEIDRLNILQATLLAMRRAVAALGEEVDHVLVDARTIPGIETPQTALIGGDGRDGSIAAASIVAKVHRDALMRRMDEEYPGYGFSQHVGYGTALHLAALSRLGASPIHRRSFAPVARVCRRDFVPLGGAASTNPSTSASRTGEATGIGL